MVGWCVFKGGPSSEWRERRAFESDQLLSLQQKGKSSSFSLLFSLLGRQATTQRVFSLEWNVCIIIFHGLQLQWRQRPPSPVSSFTTIAHTMTSNKSNVTCQDSSRGDGCGISSDWWCYIFTALVDVSPLEIRCPHVLLLFPKPPPRPVVVRVCAWFELFQATFTATGQSTAVYLQRISWTDQVSSPCKLVPQIKPSNGCFVV